MARICGWITKLTYKSISLVVWFLHSWMTPSWSKTSLKVTFSFSKTVSIWEALILLYFQNIFSASWKRPKSLQNFFSFFFLFSCLFLSRFSTADWKLWKRPKSKSLLFPRKLPQNAKFANFTKRWNQNNNKISWTVFDRLSILNSKKK